MNRAFVCFVVSVCFCVSASAQRPSADALYERAVIAFRNGQITESVAAFDELARLVPDQAPQLWQRGIALYYAGRYQDCRAQFESHRTVNPNDVENAVWHFLCVAKAESPAKAKAALLPVGPDTRVPMGQIYRMFAGTLTPDAVLTTARSQRSQTAEFYARLYIGLYFDALGDKARAREEIGLAAADQYVQAGGYMNRVARVHMMLSK
ncbi:MAG: tetratricopeptide repeat protein [Vicinamibacterales bacterium]